MENKTQYTEIRNGKRECIKEEIKEISLESLILELGYKKLGEILYLLGESIEKGVLLELWEKDSLIRLGRVEYNFSKREVRIGSLVMGESTINFMVGHMLEETRNEWVQSRSRSKKK